MPARYMRLPSLAVLVPFILVSAASAAEIHDAARAGDLARVRALVENDPGVVQSVDASGATPLHHAAASNRTEVVAYLLEKAAAVDQRDAVGRTPLWLCADRGSSVDTAKLLLDKGADPNAVGTGLGRSSPFLMAVNRGGEPLVDLLLEHGAVPPADSTATMQRLLTQSASKGLVKLMNRRHHVPLLRRHHVLARSARALQDVLGANVAGSMPWVTPDGNYLFFLDVSGPSWVDASFIEELRKEDHLRLDDVRGTKCPVTTSAG